MFTPASDQIVSKVLDGEAIVIDLTTGIYYSMEQTAAKVWFELCNGTSLDALVQSARQAYPDDTDAPAQIEAFVAELVAEGLLSKAGPDAKPVDDMEAVSWPTTYSPQSV
ncbi:PqqD family protein [Aquicoccus sp. G2-2]|uniref:PqqD family protein n=1 Tax=Aquicoccus sp. G2-2 TaxID=3092120 RepID=UPI002ADFE8B7|nr:PqqD family protein [Aquicoccus sp. G2-2]MEA1114582.1 PqqD family protein [Aquicoccus sp. G2-2]